MSTLLFDRRSSHCPDPPTGRDTPGLASRLATTVALMAALVFAALLVCLLLFSVSSAGFEHSPARIKLPLPALPDRAFLA